MSEKSITLSDKEILSLAVQIAAASISQPAEAERSLRTAITLIRRVGQQGLDDFAPAKGNS